jgi:hypothetical protein
MAKSRSPEERAAMSRGQAARHARQRKEQGPMPTTKRCSRCGKVKRSRLDFTMARVTLADGFVREYAQGMCKACCAEKSAKWRAAQDKDVLRTKRATAQRKYRAKRKRERDISLDPAPFLSWYTRFEPELTDNEQRTIRRLKSGEQKTVDLAFVDMIMTGAGAPDQVAVLYPFEED